jgi:XTP/dITP diphosphohydrolase
LRLLIATTNRGKLREIRHVLAGVPVDIISLDAFPDIAEPEETGATFAENAREKALYYMRASGLPTVAEDSGLEVDALDGAPGVQSARFGGGAHVPYDEKFRLIHEALAARPEAPRTARFVCALAFGRQGQIAFEATGTIEGAIAIAPRGSDGFGYDPIFFYPPLGKTLAELSQDQKAAVSHRGQAFRRLKQYLEPE